MGFGIFCSFANHSALFYFSKKFFLNKTLNYNKMNITIQILDLMTRGLTNGIRGIFDIKIAKNSLTEWRNYYIHIIFFIIIY